MSVQAVPVRRSYRGAEDLRAILKHEGKVPSRFGELAAEIVAAAFYGFSRISDRSDNAVAMGKWGEDDFAEMPLPWHRELANYDDDQLTRLVLIAADAGVRVGINAGLMIFKYDHRNSEGRMLGYDVTNDEERLADDFGVRLGPQEEEVPNDDFDPDQPEDPKENQRTTTREITIGVGPVLVLRLRLLPKGSRLAKGYAHSGVPSIDESRAGVELRAWPRGDAQARFPDLYDVKEGQDEGRGVSDGDRVLPADREEPEVQLPESP